MQIFGSKFWISNAPEFRQLFDTSKNLKKSTLNDLQNSQLVTYSKIQTKVCRRPWGAPMDWCLMKSVNAKYPLICCKCVEKPPKSGTFRFEAPARAPKCLAPPQKWYHHIAQPSAYLQPQALRKSHRSFIEKKLIFWDPIFWHKYSNGPGVTKKWHISNLTKKGPRTCHKLSWAQIWEKNSNGKCPKWAIRDSQLLQYKVV